MSAPPAIVVMGVSGSGKSTVAKMLAESLGCSFIEADDFHSEANKEKMRDRIPLMDEDRTPWLEAVREAVREKLCGGERVTLACSALKLSYRDILRGADPSYKPGEYDRCSVKFFCLRAPGDVIAGRMTRRSKEGQHFMPASLLQSQLDLLRVVEAEGVAVVDATVSSQSMLENILALFSSEKSN